jgi:hypothetical protein
MKKYQETMKLQHNELNKRANSKGAYIIDGEKLIREDPKVIRIDGIRAKNTDTFMGEKI